MKNSDTTHAITPELLEELRSLVRDAESALAETGEAANDKIKAFRERLKHTFSGGRAKFDHAREYTKEHLQDADVYVRGHPYQSIGLAAVAGVLIGVLITRKIG